MTTIPAAECTAIAAPPVMSPTATRTRARPRAAASAMAPPRRATTQNTAGTMAVIAASAIASIMSTPAPSSIARARRRSTARQHRPIAAGASARRWKVTESTVAAVAAAVMSVRAGGMTARAEPEHQESMPRFPCSSRCAVSTVGTAPVMTGTVVVAVVIGTDADSSVPSSRSVSPRSLRVGRPDRTGP